jgi:hypothetical protein
MLKPCKKGIAAGLKPWKKGFTARLKGDIVEDLKHFLVRLVWQNPFRVPVFIFTDKLIYDKEWNLT